ncbi:MAG: hypothetical protein H7A55_01120 [Verrucomicrobiaceae bacterium]|nr:hypothetical protein [Verrucomicrobiaceae bacterium]
MTLTDFRAQLCAHSDKPLLLILPDGGLVPSHFHVTEVGHVKKNFIDCGGTRRSIETCLLQTWVANDTDHRLVAGKLEQIFTIAGDVLPSQDLPVEVEYEDDLTAQFPVIAHEIIDGALAFHLGWKHTDCLAKEKCLPDSGCCA